MITAVTERAMSTMLKRISSFGILFCFLSISLIGLNHGIEKEKAEELIKDGDESYEKANYKEAENKFEKSLKIFEQINEKKGIAEGSYNLGKVYNRLSKYDKAIESLERALRLHEEIGDRKGMGSDLTETAYAAMSRSRYSKSLELSERALEMHEEVGSQKGVADTLRNIGEAHRYMGNYDKALEYGGRSLTIAEEIGDKRGLAESHRNLGVVHYLQSNYPLALEYYQKSLKILEEIGDKSGVAVSVNNIGVVHHDQGNYPQALEYYQKALKVNEEIGYKRGVAVSLNNTGGVHYLLSNHRQALEYYQKALKILEEIGDKNGVAATLNNIGHVDRDLGHYTEALEYHQKALKIREEIGDKNGVAQSVHTIGLVHSSLGNYAQAAEYLQKSLKIAEEIGDKRVVASILSSIGSVHYYKKEMLDADRNLSEAIKISKEIRNPGSLWASLYRKGLVSRDIGRTVEAVDSMREAIEVIEKVRGQIQLADEKTSFLQEKFEVYESLIPLLFQLQDYPQAFNYAERMKARAFLDLLSEARVNVQQAIEPDLLNRKREIEARLSFLQRKLQQAYAQSKVDNKQREGWKVELDSKFNDYEQLQREIRQRHRKYADLQYPQPVTVGQVQRFLDDETVLMEYLTTSGTSFLFVITKEDYRLYPLEKNRKEIETLIREEKEEGEGTKVKWFTQEKLKSLGIRQSLVHPPSNPIQPLHLRQPAYYIDHYLKRAHQLYENLIRPAESLLARKKHLIIVPDGILAYLPFEVLLKQEIKPKKGERIDFSNLPYLIKDYSVCYVQSASVLTSLKNNQAQKENPQMDLLAYGDPAYATSGRASATSPAEEHHGLRTCDAEFPRLDYSRDEVNRIARLYDKRSVVTYLGAEASEENVKKERLENYRRIHFATHACLNENKPQFSALVLSPGKGGYEDGLLQVYEIFNLKLNADLVVLSACETGLGKEIRGEGLIGLTRAFMYAGTPSVVASLWNVADFTSAELMERFYGKLKEKDKAESIREVKLEIIQRGIKKSKYYSHPFFWSPFVLIGDR